MDDTAWADGEDIVEGFAFGVAVEGFDIEAFVESGVADLSADAAGVADEAEFAAFPGGGGLAFEGAVDELIELVSGIAEESVVGGGEAEFEGGLLGDERAGEEEREEEEGEGRLRHEEGRLGGAFGQGWEGIDGSSGGVGGLDGGGFFFFGFGFFGGGFAFGLFEEAEGLFLFVLGAWGHVQVG